jgi:hypothetical protein
MLHLEVIGRAELAPMAPTLAELIEELAGD